MFDNLKVNQNSLMNLLKTTDRENPESQVKRGSTDFMAMVFERTGSDRNEAGSVRSSSFIERDSHQQVASADRNTRQDSSITRDRESDASIDRKSSITDKPGTESVRETAPDSRNSQLKKSTGEDGKSQKNRKDKDSDDLSGLAEQLGLELNLRKLADIIKSSLTGNKKGIDENLNKLIGGLRLKGERGNPDNHVPVKNGSQHKSLTLSEELIKRGNDLKQSIGRELARLIDSKKGSARERQLTDREIRDLAVEIVESLKKGKTREKTKSEITTVSADEHKADKKTPQNAEPVINRKLFMQDSSSFDKNGSTDKHSGRENFSYSGAKIEITQRGISDKADIISKMPDFRESLQELIDKAKITVRDSRNGSFTVRLNPQELGNVNVNLVMENGVITGKFLVDSEDAKNLLMGNLNDLRFQLEGAGVSVGEFSVNVNNQRERFLKQRNDEMNNGMELPVKEIETVTAAESYFTGSEYYTGHINMVI